MTRDDGHLHDLSEMDEDFFRKSMRNDNLTLADMEKLTEQEKESGVVTEDRRPLVDRLKGKSRRVRRNILKAEFKKAKGNVK